MINTLWKTNKANNLICNSLRNKKKYPGANLIKMLKAFMMKI